MSTVQNATTITAQPGTPFLEVVREFDAPRDLVFRAHTDPALVAQWLGPRDRETEIEYWDVRSGGGYRYRHFSAGDDFEAWFRGVYHTVEADEIVIQTFEWEGARHQVCIQTASFEDVGGRTRLTTRSVFPTTEALETALATGMSHGIHDSMDRLAELLAAQS